MYDKGFGGKKGGKCFPGGTHAPKFFHNNDRYHIKRLIQLVWPKRLLVYGDYELSYSVPNSLDRITNSDLLIFLF